MKRIVLVVSSFPKLSETSIVNKFLALLRNDWGVRVVCNQKDPEGFRYFPKLQNRRISGLINAGCIQRPYWLVCFISPFIFLWGLVRSPLSLLRYLCKGLPIFGLRAFKQAYLDMEIIIHSPDVIHFEFGSLAAQRMYLKDLLNCRIVVSFRGFDINYAGLDDKNYYDSVWEKADILHFLGESLWARALRRGCPADKPHAFIPPAIDTGFFVSRDSRSYDIVGSEKRPLRILSVGRIEWVKGYEYALSAIRLLMDGGFQCEYHIVGDGAFWDALCFARHQLRLQDAVELLGEQFPEEVNRQLEWADIFLHTAVSEGFSNAVLEAQAMGLPVVCSNAGGLPENVIDGETGFVVERRNPSLFAEKMGILARDPDLRERLGKNAKKRVAEKFSLSSQIPAFEKIYMSLLP